MDIDVDLFDDFRKKYRVKRPLSSGLDGTKYKLNHSIHKISKKILKEAEPKQLISPIHNTLENEKYIYGKSLMNNKELKEKFSEMEENSYFQPLTFDGCMVGRKYKIKNIIRKDNGDIIIEATAGKLCTPKEPKDRRKEIIQEILPLIDFSKDKIKDNMIGMLASVFTPEILKEILESESPEVLLFEKLMYLKVDKTAYRL